MTAIIGSYKMALALQTCATNFWSIFNLNTMWIMSIMSINLRITLVVFEPKHLYCSATDHSVVDVSQTILGSCAVNIMLFHRS